MVDENQQAEGEPYLERPDEHEPSDELYCWMPGTDHRECGGSCISYDDTHEADQRKSPCMVLNSIRSIALSLGTQAAVSKRGEKSQKTAAVKQHIDNLPAPPEVKS